MHNEKTIKSIYDQILVIITTFMFIAIELSIILIASSALAENFGINKRIDDTGIDISNQAWPDIAILGDNIYIVWEDTRNGDYDIYFTKSNNNGTSFNNNIRVDDATLDEAAVSPSVVIDKSTGNIYVVWEDYRNSPGPYGPDIYFTNSTDGGDTFSINKRIIDEVGSNYQFVPCIAARNGFIGVIWLDERGGIYFANSTDGGNTFGENKRVNDVLGTNIFYSKIVIDSNGTIYVVWEDNPSGKMRIHFSKSFNGGNSWTPSKEISDDPLSEGQRMPDIALDANDNIYVVWRDKKDGDWDIYFAKSSDGGDIFTSSILVSEDYINEAQFHPSIAVNDDSKIFVAWLENKDFPNSENVSDIYFVNSTDGGNTFSTKQKINNCSSFSAVYTPSNTIVVKGNHAFIVWQDDRNGNWDIYFTRSNLLPSMATPISPLPSSILFDSTPPLEVTPVSDLDNDTVYYNFTISDQPDAESGTVYYSGWITSTSWKPPPLPDGKWYWHTYTYDGFNITSPNWIWNFTIDTTQGYSIQLYEGWNLISIPFIQMDRDLESVLSSINGSYDAVQRYDAGDATDHWKHHHISKPVSWNDLKEVDHKIGFWIHITEPGGVFYQYTGIIPNENQNIPLKPGWNLVGYPSLSNKTRTAALNNLTYGADVDAIWTYNASSQTWQEVGPTDYFELGRGYWIHSKVTKTWDVPL